MKKKAIIISIKGTSLSNKERSLLLKNNPWGLILFKRNIKSLQQVKKLTNNIRKLTKDRNFPILIDEEAQQCQDFEWKFIIIILTLVYLETYIKLIKKLL